MKLKKMMAIVAAMLLTMGIVACNSEEPQTSNSTNTKETTAVTTEKHSHTTENGWQTDDENHWQVCSCGEIVNKSAHSGGEATSDQKAVCETCGKEYGELDDQFDDSNLGGWH